MQEKTHCTLNFFSVLSKSQILEAIEYLNHLNHGDPDIEEALSEGHAIHFEDVVDGEIDLKLQAWLFSSKISYTWQWSASGDIGAGINFFDAEKDEHHILRLHENLVVVPVQSIGTEAERNVRYALNRLKEIKKE